MTTPPNSKADRPNMAALVTSWRTYSILHGFYTLKDRQGRRGNDQALGPAQQSTIAEVQAHATRVAPTGPTPDVPGDAPFRLAFLFCKDAARPPKNALAHACQREHWFWQQAPRLRADDQLRLPDPAEWFCDASRCRHVDAVNRLLYHDRSHLSQAGAS